MRIASVTQCIIAILATTTIAKRPRQRRAEYALAEGNAKDQEKPVVVPGRYIVEFAPVSLVKIV